jgi:trk system potassium uptake protein TrkH
MELLDAESPGPTGDRLTPKVRETAQRLWAVYVGLTVATAVGFAIAGMSAFDAVSHSFTTVSTGGFSNYNRSLAHFESAAIEWVAIVGMFLAGGSFASYYRLLRGRAGPLLRSVEFRAYCVVVVATSGFFFFSEADSMGYGHDGARGAMFSVVSIVTTTGFATVDFASWSEVAQVIVLLLLPVGAMAGSTAGGVKLVRVLAVGSVARRELARQLHPRVVRPVRVGATVLDEMVTSRVLGFLVLALAIFGTGMFAVSLTGEDLVTSFSASASAFGNVGPGLGDVGPTADFLELSAPARGVLQAVMLLGRLEIYPVLLALFAIAGRVPVPRRRR